MTESPILVIASTGKTGRRIVDRLREQGRLVAELDFKSIHPNILYASKVCKCQAQMPISYRKKIRKPTRSFALSSKSSS
jgi:nucleoside-diphosphate-sugar epimerase